MNPLFINALQLSLNSKIESVVEDEGWSHIVFEEVKRNDPKMRLFEKLIPGKWSQSGKTYQISNLEILENERLVNFLQLTRLEEKNIIKLAEIDARYRPLVHKLELIVDGPIESFDSLNARLFEKVAAEKMTLRELSEKTGLSQVALSQLKKGTDMKVSNLFKILKALGLFLKLE